MKKLLIAIVALFSVITLSACTHLTPTDAKEPTTHHSDQKSPDAPASSTPTKDPFPPVSEVASPWKKGDFQKGIQVYWHTNDESDQETELKADTLFNYIVKLGANSVGINFPIYVDGQYPTRTYAGDNTPTPHQLAIILQQAQLHKLRVSVRPTIDEKNIVAMGGSYWRGTIQPPDPSGWFNGYGTFLTPYLETASLGKADEFVLGTELSSLQGNQAGWDQVHAVATQHFGGELSFAINWTTYQQGQPGPYEETGLDAYPQFPNLPDTASVETVTASWNQWLAATRATGKTLTLQEVGIPAQPGVYKNPANWGSSTASTEAGQTIQATWFTAACQAAHQNNTEGIYFWNVDVNADTTGANVATDSAGSFIGRAGETAIKQCFAT